MAHHHCEVMVHLVMRCLDGRVLKEARNATFEHSISQLPVWERLVEGKGTRLQGRIIFLILLRNIAGFLT
jgi:hypothetical protein